MARSGIPCEATASSLPAAVGAGRAAVTGQRRGGAGGQAAEVAVVVLVAALERELALRVAGSLDFDVQDRTGYRTEDPCFLAAGDSAGRGRLGKQTAVTRPPGVGLEGAQLSVKTQNGP